MPAKEKNKALKLHNFNIGQKMDLILETGQLLMENGADTNRITLTMKRVAKSMGICESNVHIHITYTTIMLNICEGDHSVTRFQKCIKHGLDMTVVSAVSKLSWQLFKRERTLNEYRHYLRFNSCRSRFFYGLWVVAGAGLGCGAFCKLFGGDLISALYTALCAMIGFEVNTLCKKVDINPYACTAIAAFISTYLAYLSHFLPSNTPWHPLLACSLFLVPGFPLINSLEDMLDNYITAGTTRAINTFLIVSSMTFGIFLAIHLAGVTNFSLIDMSPHATSYFVIAIAAGAGALGFSTIFNVPPRLLWAVILGGIIAICIRNYINFGLGMGLPMGSFLGSMAVSLYAIAILPYVHTPMHVITIPSVIPMIPGVLMYRLLFGIMNINIIDLDTFLIVCRVGVIASLTIIAIAIGVALPNIFFKRYMLKKKSNI